VESKEHEKHQAWISCGHTGSGTFARHGNRGDSIRISSVGARSRVIDALGRTTLLQCDAAGRVMVITNPAGETNRRSYDALDRMGSYTNAASHTVRYPYDAAGRLLSVTDPKDQSWVYGYDGHGRVESETTPMAAPPPMHIQPTTACGPKRTRTASQSPMATMRQSGSPAGAWAVKPPPTPTIRAA